MTILTPARRNGLIVALATFGLDRAVKWFLSGPYMLPIKGVVPVVPAFALRWTENRGVSLGLLAADSNLERWLLVAATSAIALGVTFWLLREREKFDILGLALVLGGALGNIWDRVNWGFVIDYADLHFGEFRPFQIFNFADAAITIGVIILLARSLLLREKPANKSVQETSA